MLISFGLIKLHTIIQTLFIYINILFFFKNAKREISGYRMARQKFAKLSIALIALLKLTLFTMTNLAFYFFIT